MADPKRHGMYALVSDDDSEGTIAGSVDSLEKPLSPSHYRSRRGHAARSHHRRRETRLAWIRWGVVVALQTAIVVLLALRPSTPSSPPAAAATLKDVETGGDINGLYPTRELRFRPCLKVQPLTIAVGHDYRRLKMEDEIYMPNMSSNVDRLEVRKRWDALMPRKFLTFRRPWAELIIHHRRQR